MLTITQILEANVTALARLKASAQTCELGADDNHALFFRDVAAAAEGLAAMLQIALDDTAAGSGGSLIFEGTTVVPDDMSTDARETFQEFDPGPREGRRVDAIGTTPEGAIVTEIKAGPQ